MAVFICGQSILKYTKTTKDTDVKRYALFCCRVFIYGLSLTQMLYNHVGRSFKAYRHRKTMKIFSHIPVPQYLQTWQEATSFALMTQLVAMIIMEPTFWCFGSDGPLFDQLCDDAKDKQFMYSFVSMCAIATYYLLILDLAVISTKVSAYVLVIIRMLSEVCLFLLALCSVLLAFGSAISVLKHDQSDFSGIQKGGMALLKASLDMFDGDHFELYEKDPVVMMSVIFFLIVVSFFLMNMLTAQLTCAYEAVYVDMLGYARLERIDTIVSTMPAVSEKRWETFCSNLRLDEKCEFNAGDVGVAGGIQTEEPANRNPTTKDMIRRFGGSTSVEMQWPAEADEDDEGDKYERLEEIIQKTLKRINKSGKGAKGGGGSSGSGGDNQISGSGSGAEGNGHSSSGAEEGDS